MELIKLKPTEAKERIIQATIALINESEGDVANISARSIAEKAGVGLGMINYHFQTKENLIDVCVERIIGDVISDFKPDLPQDKQTPVENVKNTAKHVADFLFDNPAVSRISILSDLKSPKEIDNTIRSVLGVEKALSGLDIDETDKHLIAFSLVSTMQALFLRQELFGIDVHNKIERDEILDLLVDQLIHGVTEETNR